MLGDIIFEAGLEWAIQMQFDLFWMRVDEEGAYGDSFLNPAVSWFGLQGACDSFTVHLAHGHTHIAWFVVPRRARAGLGVILREGDTSDLAGADEEWRLLWAVLGEAACRIDDETDVSDGFPRGYAILVEELVGKRETEVCRLFPQGG